jgi:hypothetical protein
VKAAQKHVGSQNAYIRAYPRLDNYTRSSGSSPLLRKSEQLATNATLVKAAAPVAEADTIAKTKNGTLQEDHSLPPEFARPRRSWSGQAQGKTWRVLDGEY